MKRLPLGILLVTAFAVSMFLVVACEEDVESLIATLEEDEDPEARESAARSLGDRGDIRGVEPLISAMQNDEDAGVRFWAAQALAEIGHAGAVEPLISALQNDEDGGVRATAAKALGKIGDAGAVEPLIAALHDDELDYTANKALEALEARGALEPLLTDFRNRDLEAIAPAYYFFIFRGEPGTEDILIELLNSHGTVEMAEDFVNSGNNQLEGAARDWAETHGYTITVVEGLHGGPMWGGY
jgi:HEAT repeat protein